MVKQRFGLYEKALPREWSIEEKLKTAKALGYDYFELSTDESDKFQERMRMDRSGRAAVRKAIWDSGLPIWTMCLSGTRNCPIGSKDPDLRKKGFDLTMDAIHFSADIGIRVIQPMAYDEYYGERDAETYGRFMDNLEKGLSIVNAIGSPWLQLFPDIANLYATGMGNEAAAAQYKLAKEHIVASHVKDTVVGKFRDIPFGEGEVDFDMFFRTIHEENIHGPFTLEIWAHNYSDPVEAAGLALNFVKSKYERSR